MCKAVKLDKEGKHRQCLREIMGTLAVVSACCVWHIGSAWLLNGSGRHFLGVPAWFSVSVLGSLLILFCGILYLQKRVFADFEYDDEVES